MIVCLCYKFLQSILKSKTATNMDELLWNEMLDEILCGELKTERVKLKKKIKNIGTNGLMTSLYTVLSICGQYNDIYYILKDSYGTCSQLPVSAVHSLSRRLKQGNITNDFPTQNASMFNFCMLYKVVKMSFVPTVIQCSLMLCCILAHKHYVNMVDSL